MHYLTVFIFLFVFLNIALAQPSFRPTANPSTRPTFNPTSFPSIRPTPSPSSRPTPIISSNPTIRPTFNPTSFPSIRPTPSPSSRPTPIISSNPTIRPTFNPTTIPTAIISSRPTFRPTVQPSGYPTFRPTYNPTTRPTARPSGPTFAPTSRPSNPTYAPTSCSFCPEGTIVINRNGTCCAPCPSGTFSNQNNSLTCSSCQYPYYSQDGASSCSNVYLNNQNLPVYVGIGIVAISMFFGLINADNETRKYFFLMVLPMFTVIADIFVLLDLPFDINIFFLLVAFFFVIPILFFLYKIIVGAKKNPRLPLLDLLRFATGSLLWLSFENSYPIVNGNPWFKGLIDVPVLGILAAIFLWPLAILAQGITLVLSVLLAALSIPFLFVWLGVGYLLFLTSVWSIHRVWSLWVFVWNGESMKDSLPKTVTEIPSVSLDRLRLSLKTNLFVHTIPSFAVQAVNLYFLVQFDYSSYLKLPYLIGFISLAISAASLLNWIYFVCVVSTQDVRNRKRADSIKGLRNRKLSKPTANTDYDDNITLASAPYVTEDKAPYVFTQTQTLTSKKLDIHSKKCWNVLLLLSEKYPRIVMLLEKSNIDSPKDLISITPLTIDLIVMEVANGPLHSYIKSLLATLAELAAQDDLSKPLVAQPRASSFKASQRGSSRSGSLEQLIEERRKSFDEGRKLSLELGADEAGEEYLLQRIIDEDFKDEEALENAQSFSHVDVYSKVNSSIGDAEFGVVDQDVESNGNAAAAANVDYPDINVRSVSSKTSGGGVWRDSEVKFIPRKDSRAAQLMEAENPSYALDEEY